MAEVGDPIPMEKEKNFDPFSAVKIIPKQFCILKLFLSLRKTMSESDESLLKITAYPPRNHKKVIQKQ